jgi:NAD(P)H-dependent flavin oxidoreductase YrpB (nitropropane dioxygenase family)
MSLSQDPSAVAMPVGQIVGRMNEIRPAADIVAELVTGFDEATSRLDDIRNAE